MEKINLSESEKDELIQEHQLTRDGKIRDKIKAILMLDQGYNCLEIAKILLLDEKTIRRWKDKYKAEQTISDFLVNNCTGYDGKLSTEQIKTVEIYVKESLISNSIQLINYGGVAK